MSKQTMQFLYGDRELIITVADILSTTTDVIVNSANAELIHNAGLAQKILAAAGDALTHESQLFIDEHGRLESGMAVYTGAGKLPYKAIIHAVGPKMGEGEEQYQIEQAVLRSLQLCEMNDWHSIAFPAISTGINAVPVPICAQACFRAITHFWDARNDGVVQKIVICLTAPHFDAFFQAFREAGQAESSAPIASQNTTEQPVGVIELNEDEVYGASDEDINDWFK